MRVAVFFVCLCFMLLKGIDNPLGRTYYSGVGYALAANEEEKHLAVVTNGHRDCCFFRDTRPVTEEECLLTEEVEDEDPDNLFSHKYKLLARARLIYAGLSVPKYNHRHFRSSTIFSDQASYKYLLQGVLRI